MIEKISKYCTNFKAFIYENSNSIYELLLKVLEKQDEIIDEVNDQQEQIDNNYNALDTKINNNFQTLDAKKEDSVNITNNRKLSPTGDFTGTWFGDTKTNIDGLIINGQNLYQEVVDLINTSPELNIEIIDGGFFASAVVPDEDEMGSFTGAVTEEIDCGLFIYPCQCSN